MSKMTSASHLEATTNAISDTTDLDNTDASNPNDFTEMFVVTMKMIVGIAGVTGNLTVCLAIMQMRSKEVKFLIGSQAAIDLLTSFVLVAGTITSRYPQLINPENYELGYLYCLIWHWDGLLFFLFSLSTYNLVAISIERYMAVMHPIWYRTNFSRKKAIFLGAALWVIAPTMQIVFCVKQTYYIGGQCLFISLSTLGLAVVGVLLFCWDFFGPCVIMGFCFTRICLELIKQDKNAKTLKAESCKEISTVSGNKVSHGQKEGKDMSSSASRSRNVTKTFLAVFIAFAICWSANQFLFLQRNLGGFLYHGTPVNHFANSMAILNSAINPFIYVFRFKQYREKMRVLLCCN